MQFRIPQNIDLEDKIVGPLTLKQFLYLMVGFIVIYLLFQKVAAERHQIILFLILAVPIALFCIALAFVKIQDQPFGQFLFSLIFFYIRPRRRVWQRADQTSQPVSGGKTEAAVQTPKTKKALSQRELGTLVKSLDEGGPAHQNENTANKQWDIKSK